MQFGQNDLFSAPILPSYSSLLNSENELTSAFRQCESDNNSKLLQLNQAKSNVVEALTNAMNHNNSNIAMAAANALRLNNSPDICKQTTTSLSSSPTSTTTLKQTNGSPNNQNSDTEMKKLILKKSTNERKYPCGFPGCHWIFTRSNHVVRHQRRIHGLKIDKLESHSTKIRQPRNNSLPSSSNLMNLGRNQLNQLNSNASLLLMNRKLNNLNVDYSRLNRTNFSKNSLLNSMCNNGTNEISNQKTFKITSRLHQPIKLGNIRRFQCNVNNCGQKFSNELLFNNHLKLLHNVDRSLISKNLHHLTQQQNASLNNLNSIKNQQNSNQNSMKSLVTNQEVNNTPKIVKNNLNAINNHIKLFLSNKPTSTNDSESLTCYLNNLNTKLKQLHQPKANNAVTSNVVSNIVPQQQLITKVQQVNPSTTTISLQPKMFLPITTINTLNVDQQAKPFFITQIQIPSINSSNQILANQLVTNSNQINLQPQTIQLTQSKVMIFKCEIQNCLRCFTSKDNLVDHLFDYHRVFEPEIIVTLEKNDSENWLLMDDPKDTNIGQQLIKSEAKQDQQPCKIGRSANEPSLASTLGIVKDVVTKIENVNRVHNIAANSSSTYSGLRSTLGIVKDVVTKLENVTLVNNMAPKQHVCTINDCRKSFTKRYHLVRHRLTAHNVGKLSLMEDILNANNQQQQANDQEIDDLNSASPAEKKECLPPIIVESIDRLSSTKASQKVGNSQIAHTPFYVRRPPQDVRPYPCKYPKCNWSFKRAYHLKRHIRTHRHYYENCPEEIPPGFPVAKPVDEEDEEEDEDVIELSSSASSVNSVKISQKCDKTDHVKDEENDENDENDRNGGNDEIDSIVLEEEEDRDESEEVLQNDEVEEDAEDEEIEAEETDSLEKDCDYKPTRKMTRSLEQQLKREQADQSEDLKRQAISRLTRQVKQENNTTTAAAAATTHEENSSFSSDLSNHTNQQIIQCEFSNCGKKFKRQRQYDLHVKTHLNEKPTKKAKMESTSFENDEEDLPDDKYTNAPNNTRASRTRSRTNDVNNNMSLDINKLVDNPPQPQLVLLCHPKDMIFLNGVEVKRRDKNTFICDVNSCGKRFGRNCELTRHKLNHIDFWPYVCEYSNCGKKFKRKDVYKNYQRTHEKNGDKLEAD